MYATGRQRQRGNVERRRDELVKRKSMLHQTYNDQLTFHLNKMKKKKLTVHIYYYLFIINFTDKIRE